MVAGGDGVRGVTCEGGGGGEGEGEDHAAANHGS